MKRLLLLLLVLAPAAACTGDRSPPASENVDTTGRSLSLDQVRFAAANHDGQHFMLTYSTAELFWPRVGFPQSAKIISTRDTIAALVSGEAWIAQGATSLFWAAMDEGSVDLVMVGVDKDDEVRILGARSGIASVEDIKPGMTASGGSTGDYDELVLREVLATLGVAPGTLRIVSFGGGADARMQAMIAGQLDLGILQPRNTRPLIEAGGAVLYEAEAPMPQETWVVTREVWNDHRDAVCAFIEGRVMGKQWAAEGPRMRANLGKALEIVRRHGIDPTADEIAEWEQELSRNQSLDGGAEIEAFDRLQQNFKELNIISADFDWRKHADFDCLWAVQEKLGLPRRPERR